MSQPDLELQEGDLLSPHQKSVGLARARAERNVARALSGALEKMPWKSCRVLGSKLGLAFFALGNKRRARAIDNVQLALGFNRAMATRVARRSAQNWGMTTCEFLHLPGASESEFRDYVLCDDLEPLRAALREGRGAILLTAHLGNWELAASLFAREVTLAAIMRPLNNATMQAHMSAVRRGSGMSLISKYEAARPSLKALRRGEALYILPDRHAGPDGVLLPLFGRETRFESAPARLAQMSGAPIIPVFGVRREPWLRDGRIQVRIGAPFHVESSRRDEREAQVLEGTRQVISSIENVVREHPDQWSWMLRRWRDTDFQSVEAAPST